MEAVKKFKTGQSGNGVGRVKYSINHNGMGFIIRRLNTVTLRFMQLNLDPQRRIQMSGEKPLKSCKIQSGRLDIKSQFQGFWRCDITAFAVDDIHSFFRLQTMHGILHRGITVAKMTLQFRI